MTISAKILLDSLAPCGARLTTFELHYPRFIHAEFMTHRLISRNAASSRAIPMKKFREMVLADPAVPVWWGRNQAGMQAEEELDFTNQHIVQGMWKNALDNAAAHHTMMEIVGLHKQIANRILEPWSHITVIASATDWQNFFFLRCHKAAQPEIRELAEKMQVAYNQTRPQILSVGEWHQPFIDWTDHMRVWNEVAEVDDTLNKVSVGRCARVSYLTHDGRRDLKEDIALHDKLLAPMDTHEPGHLSPFEHVAMALDTPERSGNFTGFRQYRKMIAGEHAGVEIRL
jgi:thymidylate synthase ThyX